jgi:hypothetical protein
MSLHRLHTNITVLRRFVTPSQGEPNGSTYSRKIISIVSGAMAAVRSRRGGDDIVGVKEF